MPDEKPLIVDAETREKIEAFREGKTKGDVTVRGADLQEVARELHERETDKGSARTGSTRDS